MSNFEKPDLAKYKNPIFVSGSDSTMSYWGRSKGKCNRVVCVCEGRAEADYVEQKFRGMKVLKRIEMSERCPRLSPERYLVSWYTRENAPAWFLPVKEEK
jgi:hypothetical protein